MFFRRVVLGSISLSDIGWGSAQGQRLIRPIHACLAGGSLGLIYRTPQQKYPDTSVTLLWWQRCDSGTYDVVPLHGRTIKPMGLPLTPPLTPYQVCPFLSSKRTPLADMEGIPDYIRLVSGCEHAWAPPESPTGSHQIGRCLSAYHIAYS